MHVYEQLSDGKIIPQHYVECKKPNPDGTPKLRPTWISDFKKWHAEGRAVVPSVTTTMGS